MNIHLIEGDAGCRFAVEHQGIAVIVDALRASATAAALLDGGAERLCVVGEVKEAFALKELWPDALLFGERGGLPPAGFDYGNSPQDAQAAKGKRVIFTTTTGAGRLVAAKDASQAIMASVVNTAALVRYLKDRGEKDLVIIPAGLMGDPHFDGLEDWTGAAWIAAQVYESGDHQWGEGYDAYKRIKTRIDREGVAALFSRSPHADKLRAVNLEADIERCARIDCYHSVPLATEQISTGLLLQDALA
ncbi:MAG: 2-phosphosulfolactate phosphatase [Candidatus Hydrogenedentales bacterium]